MLLQLLFTYAPPLQRLFDTEAIPLRVWPWLVAGGLVFFLVVEAEKLTIRSVDFRGAPSLQSKRELESPVIGLVAASWFGASNLGERNHARQIEPAPVN